MSVLTVRISDEEKVAVARREKEEGTTTGALVQCLRQEKPFTTSADLLEERQSMMGDRRLEVRKPK